MSVARTICLGFLAVIAVGTLLLMLPVSISSEGAATIAGPVDYFVKAWFTSTSAVCVTGLSIVNIREFYSFFGQIVLCALVQVGGLGYMTATTFLLLLLGRRLNLRDKIAIQQSLDTTGIAGVKQLITSIISVTLIFEITGIFLLLAVFIPDLGWSEGLWYAIFHSVNSFNNAGFSLFDNNYINYVTSPLLNFTVIILIIFGGIGYEVIMELYLGIRQRLVNKKAVFIFSLHFKLVTSTTLFLLLVGTLAFFQTEYNNPLTLQPLSFSEKLMAAFFQSVTTRTAGFNTLDMAGMTTAALFITIALMFIGASPGSTGGGIKTTTSRLLISCTTAALQGRDEIICYKRQIPVSLIIKAIGVAVGSLLVVIISTTLITLSDQGQNFNFIRIFFEAVSAFATVGLSTGITAELSLPSQIVLIGTMYIGRVGILLLMAAIRGTPEPQAIRYPEENLLVG
ncbi:MAG: TrkH family potassium uptake protein [Desertifilum sp.]|nr:TrkH family potassium uptake protein [Desertifilum sp.]MDI9636258.1 TrkH family potassium uptake protein [Geitlerinema splendidum]